MQSLRAAIVFLMGLAATVSALPVLAGDAIFRASMDVPTCADVEYNSGLEVQAFPSTWQNVFSLPFPNPIGNARIISIPHGGVVSLAFTPSLANPVGNVETSESPGNPGGALTLSISPCRADYRREVLTNGTLCIGSGLSSQDQLVFVTGMGTNSSFCGLVAGQTYYLNLAHITTQDGAQPVNNCATSSCATLLVARTFSGAE